MEMECRLIFYNECSEKIKPFRYHVSNNSYWCNKCSTLSGLYIKYICTNNSKVSNKYVDYS